MKKSLIYILPPLMLFLTFIACEKEPKSNPTEKTCNISVLEQKIVEEINDSYAYTFEGVNPEESDINLVPLVDYLSTARIVGLGEATHGTAEFYKMKDKLFRELVTKKGFKAIIFEIPWGNALTVNDFVINGEGSAESSVDQTFYWIYNTQEVRDLAQWMHDFNQELQESEKIYFVGCDPQGDDFKTEKKHIKDYLQKVSPEIIDDLLNNYAQLPISDLHTYSNASDNIKVPNETGVQIVYDYFVDHEQEFIAASSVFEYQVALMATHVVQQREYIYRTNNYGVKRDELMAFYANWWQQLLGPQSQVAIWAHNNHVMHGLPFGTVGSFLKSQLGSDYKNVAFSFTKGSFNAFLASANNEVLKGVGELSINNLVCGTTNQLLYQVNGDQHYLIFDELQNGDIADYFGNKHPFISLGAGFNINYISNYTHNRALFSMADVLIHFDQTTSSALK